MKHLFAKSSLVVAFFAWLANAQPTEVADLDTAVSDLNRRLSFGSEASVMRKAFGDLTYDGQKDAAVLMRSTTVTGLRDRIWIFERRGGKYVFIAELAPKRPREYVLSIAGLGSNFAIEKGILAFDQAVVKGKCCLPTMYRTIKYQWNGIKLIRLGASSPRPLPEHMREIG